MRDCPCTALLAFWDPLYKAENFWNETLSVFVADLRATRSMPQYSKVNTQITYWPVSDVSEVGGQSQVTISEGTQNVHYTLN